MNKEQPEALPVRLAKRLCDGISTGHDWPNTDDELLRMQSAAELRRLHAENEALRAQLSEKNIGQGEPMAWICEEQTIGPNYGKKRLTFSKYYSDNPLHYKHTPLYLHPAPKANKTHVLVPLRMTRAMQDVVCEEDWSWADLLAAAEAVTEDEFAAAEQTEPIMPQSAVMQREHVGVVGEMPGTSGFTMACFHADNVPVGSKLYTHPAQQQIGQGEPVAWGRWEAVGLGDEPMRLIVKECAPTDHEKRIANWFRLYTYPAPQAERVVKLPANADEAMKCQS